MIKNVIEGTRQYLGKFNNNIVRQACTKLVVRTNNSHITVQCGIILENDLAFITVNFFNENA